MRGALAGLWSVNKNESEKARMALGLVPQATT